MSDDRNKYDDEALELEDEIEVDFVDETDEYEEDFQEFTLILEDNTELECVIIAQFNVDEQGYIALLPIEGEENNILLYRATENGDSFDVSMIESDEEFELASEAYYQVVDEDLEFAGYEHDHDCGCGKDHHHHEGCGCGDKEDETKHSCGCEGCSCE